MRYGLPCGARQLTKLGRIAIWNKLKIIFVVSMAIWGADIALLFHGKYLLQIMGGSLLCLVISQV
jgi:hypothetical protein